MDREENIIFLNEGESCKINCPKCKSSNFQFLPDKKFENRDYGRLITTIWKCFNCNTKFVQIEKIKK
jgi:transposase-like protein